MCESVQVIPLILNRGIRWGVSDQLHAVADFPTGWMGPMTLSEHFVEEKNLLCLRRNEPQLYVVQPIA